MLRTGLKQSFAGVRGLRPIFSVPRFCHWLPHAVSCFYRIQRRVTADSTNAQRKTQPGGRTPTSTSTSVSSQVLHGRGEIWSGAKIRKPQEQPLNPKSKNAHFQRSPILRPLAAETRSKDQKNNPSTLEGRVLASPCPHECVLWKNMVPRWGTCSILHPLLHLSAVRPGSISDSLCERV